MFIIICIILLLLIIFILYNYSYGRYHYDVVDITTKYNAYYYNILQILRSCNTIEQIEKTYSWGIFIIKSKCDYIAYGMPIPIMIALYNMRDLNLINLKNEKLTLIKKINKNYD